MAIRKVTLAVALALVCVAILFISIGKRTLVTDCDIAKLFYNTNEKDSFEAFLENQFRMNGVIDPGNSFSDPRYSFFIYHPNKEQNKYKGYDYRISRTGIPHSRMAISMSKDAWERGRRVKCEKGFKDRPRT